MHLPPAMEPQPLPQSAVDRSTPRAPAALRYPLHGESSVRQYFVSHILGAMFPATAAVGFYGWRAIVLIGAVAGSAAAATFVWRRIGMRGRQLRYDHTLWLALLLALMLPVHLAGFQPFLAGGNIFPSHWALLPSAGIALVVFTWLLGGAGSGRVHPVLVVYLLLVILFQHALVPHWILQRHASFQGDALDAPLLHESPPSQTPWYQAPRVEGHDATSAEPASQRLIFFTTGQEPPDRSWLSLEGLLRDRMPPLEDLVLGGAPGPIGLSSAIAVIIGGLYLLHRSVIGYRVPLLIVLSAYAALLVLPVPASITSDAVRWRWLAFLDYQVGWGVALTFINYEMLAGPLLFTGFFLATAPAVRPMARRARVIYAVLIGVAAAALQLYASVSFGPYLALMAVSLLTPTLDKLFPPRPLL